MTWKIGRPDPDKVVDKNEDKLFQCPKCGNSASYGRCSVRSCGWKSKSRLEREAKLPPRKPYTKGRQKDEVRNEGPALVYDPKLLIPTRSITNQAGEVIYDEYRCPECRGRGWALNPYQSCRLCYGHGCITGTLMMFLNHESKQK